jgi:hypothetical protein
LRVTSFLTTYFSLCRFIFHGPYTFFLLLMLKRDGKWRLQWFTIVLPSRKKNIRLTNKATHPSNFHSWNAFITYALSLFIFLFVAVLFLSNAFLRTNNKNLKSKSLQGNNKNKIEEIERRKKSEERTFLCSCHYYSRDEEMKKRSWTKRDEESVKNKTSNLIHPFYKEEYYNEHNKIETIQESTNVGEKK